MSGLSTSVALQLRFVRHILLLLERSSLVRHSERRLALGLALAVVKVLLHHIGARLTFTAIRFSTDISCLLCLRVVAKFLHEEGNFAIMHPATNLSGKAHLACSSSLAMHCIS